MRGCIARIAFSIPKLQAPCRSRSKASPAGRRQRSPMTFTFHRNPRNSNHRAWGLLRDLPSQQSASPHNRQGSGSQGRLRPRVGSISGLSLAAATRALCSVRSEIPPRGLRGLRRTPRPSQHRTAPRGWRGMERNPRLQEGPTPNPRAGLCGPQICTRQGPGHPQTPAWKAALPRPVLLLALTSASC